MKMLVLDILMKEFSFEHQRDQFMFFVTDDDQVDLFSDYLVIHHLSLNNLFVNNIFYNIYPNKQ